MMKKTVRDIDLNDKRVVMRVDYNVPLNAEGRITDDTRIRATLPTLRYLQEKGARVVLISHLGRPKGKPNPSYSLKPVAERLTELLSQKIKFARDCIGKEARRVVASLRPREVALLENLRFHPEEEKNDPEFAHELAGFGDVFVNDAFGVSHRAHASVAGIPHYLPAVAGFLLEREILFLHDTLNQPERPFAAILGGAKITDKIGVIENLLKKVDCLLIGGGIANTFIKAQGYEIGKSIVDEEKVEFARDILERAKKCGVKILLPLDVVVAKQFSADAAHKVMSVHTVPDDWMILDIGPATAAAFAGEIRQSRTVIWNGPMGAFEMDAFAKGTHAVAEAMATVNGTTIIGGGDSVAAIKELNLTDKMTHVSTGGGATLEYMEGKALPGVVSLLDKDAKASDSSCADR